ncbi:Alpha-ketoglutarate-dependent dioxygenase AlkB, partial [Ananas comosus]
SKLAECDSERRPFDTCVDESKTLESYSDTRGGPFRDVKQGEAKASVDRKSSSCSWKLAGCDSERRPFDICLDESKRTVFTLRPSLLELNREKRRNCQKKYLRPGMVLLKGFIGHDDQASFSLIIKICRELGIGAGGFYTPGYSDGAKLHLLMMCLGKNWDPETSSYEEKRFFDGAIPPEIPRLFKRLVENAIRASHDFLVQEEGVKNVEEELPWMSPDICIANFYSNSGKLGLHQDKDESKSSLVKGLPVVSFSLGDSAEFLYGVERDAAKAERIELESGDVLLFGGKSRNIFHGVPCIKPKTAPKRLIEDSNLRPGRLNLTFRQY